MKKILILALGMSLGATLSEAQDDATAKAREARRAEMIKKYDKNGDGQLDETEKAALRADNQKKREEERLKKYDKNGDGKLDEAEKEAMKEDLKKRFGEGRKARGEGEKPANPPTAPAVPAAPKN